MIYLLDSNAWIAFLRRPNSPVVARLQAQQPGDIRVCSVVVAELRYGCLRSAKPAANLARVEALLAPLCELAFRRQGSGAVRSDPPAPGNAWSAHRPLRPADRGHRPRPRLHPGDTQPGRIQPRTQAATRGLGDALSLSRRGERSARKKFQERIVWLHAVREHPERER